MSELQPEVLFHFDLLYYFCSRSLLSCLFPHPLVFGHLLLLRRLTSTWVFLFFFFLPPSPFRMWCTSFDLSSSDLNFWILTRLHLGIDYYFWGEEHDSRFLMYKFKTLKILYFSIFLYSTGCCLLIWNNSFF